MYRSFHVRNFRCFRDLTLTGLERVNLIAGANNVGKTALLEALFLHCGAYNPSLTLRLNPLRGIQMVKLEFGHGAEAPWDSLFAGFDTSESVELSGENEATGGRRLTLKLLRTPEELAQVSQVTQQATEPSEFVPVSPETPAVVELEYSTDGGQSGRYLMVLDQKGDFRVQPVPPPPPFFALFLPARGRVPLADDAERFGRMEVVGRQDVVSEALQVIEPRLCRVAVVVRGGVPMLHGDIGLGRLIPLPLMGGGMARLASLVLAIGDASGGVVLVDEIENGLHHSVLPRVWQAIGEVARRFSTQVFATTHSFECIVSAHQAFSANGPYDFRLHRLERTQQDIRAVTYDQETLEAAIETGLEVR
jgi:hypothetical protein